MPKPSCVTHCKKKHHAWRLSRQGICRPKGWNWLEYGNALPVFPGRPPHRTMIRGDGPVQ